MNCNINEDPQEEKFWEDFSFHLSDWWKEHLFDSGSCFEQTTFYGNMHFSPPCKIPDEPDFIIYRKEP